MMDFPSKFDNLPHVVVCPSAGIGHLTPFLRLASMLATKSNSNCRVTLITLQPTLSIAEANQISSFLSSHPHIHSFEIPVPADQPANHNNNSNGNSNGNNNASTTSAPKEGPDPFFVRYAAISRSAHLLTAQIASLSPPPTAVVSDIMFASGFNEALPDLGIPNYLLTTTSARFFSLTSYLPYLATANGDVPRVLVETDPNEIDQKSGDVEAVCYFPPGMPPVSKTSIPPPFFNPNHIFTKMLVTNKLSLHKFKGVLLNTFDAFEHETLASLRTGKPLPNLPPIFPIGPLKHWNHKEGSPNNLPRWLDEQPAKSVLYVSFGSRSALGRDQIRELGVGLELSGVQFLWMLKTTKVDKEESKDDDDLKGLLGEGFLDRTKGRGLVVKEWVDQEAVLDHPAIGGFLTHCGWNSIIEAAHRGIPMLAWPLHGDQKVNASVVEKAGLGVWGKGWGWVGERLVKGEEIAEKIKEVMMNEELRASAKKVSQEAAKSWSVDGSSSKMFDNIVSDIFGSSN